ncbi:hypothetical protein JOF36_003236 [Pseudonocardia parietis]|uniref:Uncharacterized protein n=1 Tax=Pseudonocardia parietis TaxID=570936 RepID=A0ABS4VUF5_9PSEU|nr:hypothetical protein [Pseudonocardia parietis]
MPEASPTSSEPRHGGPVDGALPAGAGAPGVDGLVVVTTRMRGSWPWPSRWSRSASQRCKPRWRTSGSSSRWSSHPSRGYAGGRPWRRRRTASRPGNTWAPWESNPQPAETRSTTSGNARCSPLPLGRCTDSLPRIPRATVHRRLLALMPGGEPDPLRLRVPSRRSVARPTVRASVRYALREVDGMARCRHPGDLPARRGHDHLIRRRTNAVGPCHPVPGHTPLRWAPLHAPLGFDAGEALHRPGRQHRAAPSRPQPGPPRPAQPGGDPCLGLQNGLMPTR